MSCAGLGYKMKVSYSQSFVLHHGHLNSVNLVTLTIRARINERDVAWLWRKPLFSIPINVNGSFSAGSSNSSG